MADVHRITLYYDMVVQYTDCQCQLLGNDFAGQCSNLDMCLNNDHHGMDECKRSFGQQQSLVCQSSSLATIIHTSFLLMMAICEENAILSVPLISTLLLFSAGLWYGWKVKSLFYLAIIPFAALMILLTTFISQSGLRDVQIFFYGGLLSSPEQLYSFTSFFI